MGNFMFFTKKKKEGKNRETHFRNGIQIANSKNGKELGPWFGGGDAGAESGIAATLSLQLNP